MILTIPEGFGPFSRYPQDRDPTLGAQQAQPDREVAQLLRKVGS
ncbi:MAG TPA: hypothetical protein VL944_01360 [Candidatus Acidoferrum sp.]|nr:hypothetical protein [Candidatus Acidoferrum sp.]